MRTAVDDGTEDARPGAVPDGIGGSKKMGLADSEIRLLVRAVKGGLSYEDAVAALNGRVAEGVLAGWKGEIHRLARSGPAAAASAQELPTPVAAKAAPSKSPVPAPRGRRRAL